MRLALIVVAACGGSPAKPQPPATPVEPAAVQTTPDQLTGPVQSVAVHAADHRDELEAIVNPLAGKPLDPFTLRERLVQVLAVPGVADVVARGVQRAGGIELVIDVTPQPIVHAVSAIEVGGAVIQLGGGLGAQTYGAGAALAPRALDELADTLRRRYEDTGHLAAEARWTAKPVAGGVDVVIEVTPGPASTIASIAFSGNAGVSSAALAKELAGTLAVGDAVKTDAIGHAAEVLDAYYWEHGYANIRVRAPEPVAGPNKLVFDIQEGPIFKIGKLKVTGEPPAKDHAVYLKAFGVKTGDVFKRSALVAGRDRVVAAATAAGITNPSVTPLTKVDLVRSTIDLTLEIAHQ